MNNKITHLENGDFKVEKLEEEAVKKDEKEEQKEA